LLRLFEASGEEEFRSAASEAIEYETALFDPSADNWPDLREDDQPAFKPNWCHGAPGIGLARLGGLTELATESVRRDIEAAVRATLATDLEYHDHLCCGNMGRVELLTVAGERLGRPDLVEEARDRAGRVAGRAQAVGWFSLDSTLPGRVHMPGFFMGLSGIGFGLLRAAQPGVLPSVLLLE
jgi:lantibiotic modifying enzyme